MSAHITTSSGGLRQRVYTALILAPLALAAVTLLPQPWFALLLGALFALGLWEWTRLSGLEPGLPRILILLINVGLMALLWLAGVSVWAGLAWLGVGFWIVAISWLFFHNFALARKRRYILVKLMAGMLAVIPAWCACLLLRAASPDGASWVLYVIVLVWCADVFAYFTGKKFGTTKLAPHISPGKTRAGVYGAFAGAALYSLIGDWVFDIRGTMLIWFALLSLITVAFSIAGDLFESLIKRHSKVKDSGTLFPGHGGVFDRLDSMFAALPVFAVGKTLLAL